MKTKIIEELKARVAYLEDILDSIPVGIIVADAKGKIMLMNRWQENISRIKREKVLGSYFHEAWRRLFDQGIMSEYWKLLDEGKPYHMVLHEVYPQYYNEKISAISRGAPLSEGKGVVILHDISKEMQHDHRVLGVLTKKLTESANFLTNLIDSSSNIVITTNPAGIIESINKTGVQLLQYGRRSLCGKHISFIFKDPVEFDGYNSIAVTGRGIDVWCKKKNDKVFPAKMHKRDIKDSEGNSQAKLYLLADLTWEKTIEEKLALSEKLAIYSELMAGIAHQLNNPLVGVVNFSALLLQKLGTGDPNRKLVETIFEAAQKCNNLLSSMIKTLHDPMSTFCAVDITAVLQRAIQVAWENRSAGAGHITLKKNIHKKLPVIRGDSLQLIEALRNIIDNAIQAMPDGGELGIQAVIRKDEKEIHLQISDTGIGIPEENLEKIFTPFFTTKASTGGGLGLSFSFQVIKRHSGIINVKSTLQKGSVFTVILPFFDRQG